ncbi:MAG: hypothetical protein GWO02_05145 [Gammaproteobacteria bacterium]|nr:hypothetical protein [Gammaproteobacteria bacterium]
MAKQDTLAPARVTLQELERNRSLGLTAIKRWVLEPVRAAIRKLDELDNRTTALEELNARVQKLERWVGATPPPPKATKKAGNG